MAASSVTEFLKFQFLPLSLKYSTQLLKTENFEVRHNFCDKHKNIQNINKRQKNEQQLYLLQKPSSSWHTMNCKVLPKRK